MRIGELARRTGKSVATLRYYEQLGLLPTPERTESGYRDYQPDIVERVRFIGQAQERGFSLEEIATVLALHDQGQAPCECVLETTRRKLVHLERLIAEMQERHAALSHALRRWQSGGYPRSGWMAPALRSREPGRICVGRGPRPPPLPEASVNNKHCAGVGIRN